MRKLLSNRIVKLEKTIKNLEDGSKSIMTNLKAPAGTLFTTSENQLHYDFELDHRLKELCQSFSLTVIGRKTSTKQNLANLAALYAITDCITFNMTNGFNIVDVLNFHENYFAIVKNQVFYSSK